MTYSVSVLPLITGGVFNMLLGALWYSNVLFAKPWMREAGVTDEDVADTSNMGLVYGMTFATALLTSYVIGFIMINLGVGLFEALVAAILVWLGADLPMIVKNWGFEGRAVKLGIINHGYQLVVYLVVAVLHVVL